MESEKILGNRERVKEHRKRRKSAGLKEIKLWVREIDIPRIFTLLHPFLKVADNVLHAAKGGQWSKHKIGIKDKLFIGD